MESFHFCRYEFSWKCSFWKPRWLDAVIPQGCPCMPLRQPPWDSVLRAFGLWVGAKAPGVAGARPDLGTPRPDSLLDVLWLYEFTMLSGALAPRVHYKPAPREGAAALLITLPPLSQERDCLRPHTGVFPAFADLSSKVMWSASLWAPAHGACLHWSVYVTVHIIPSHTDSHLCIFHLSAVCQHRERRCQSLTPQPITR